MTQANVLLAGLEQLVDAGMLRHLGVAFARFIATLSAPSPSSPSTR